ncbi:MAG: cache domain-containing protein [Candidatus Competibacter sp.]
MRTVLLGISLTFGLMVNAFAAEFGTAEEAQVLVKKAIAHIQSAGPEKAYADFTAKNPEFVNKDLYVFVNDVKGNTLAHGTNEKLVGRNMSDLKDVDGKAFLNEISEKAKTQDSFSVDYKFTDPVTKKILPKTIFCERLKDTAVCSGIYKR